MNMNLEQAVNVLEQALNVASKEGVFLLQDAAVVQTAITVLKQEFDIKPKFEPDSEPEPETTKDSN